MIARSLALVPVRGRLAWARISSWWPDVFAGLLVSLGCSSLLFGADDLDSVSIARATTDGIANGWLAVTAVAGAVLAYSMLRRRYTLAAIASASIAVLLSMNALAAIYARGPGVIVSIVGYSLAAVYLAERAKQLDAHLPNMPESHR